MKQVENNNCTVMGRMICAFDSVMEKRIAIVLEKFGTAVWKRFIQNAEFGLCPKEYNRRVHGIYVPWRYYGKADIPFGQVKISDLGAWIKRRNKTPIAIWQCLDRAFHYWQQRYWVNCRYPSMTFTYQVALIFSIMAYFARHHDGLKLQNQYRYHW
uniref:Uncharacterized protein n=1 Tax=Romanomermis culicivorax TaxID=13658 RepID=A0A915JSZ2_ROMCU